MILVYLLTDLTHFQTLPIPAHFFQWPPLLTTQRPSRATASPFGLARMPVPTTSSPFNWRTPKTSGFTSLGRQDPTSSSIQKVSSSQPPPTYRKPVTTPVTAARQTLGSRVSPSTISPNPNTTNTVRCGFKPRKYLEPTHHLHKKTPPPR